MQDSLEEKLGKNQEWNKASAQRNLESYVQPDTDKTEIKRVGTLGMLGKTLFAAGIVASTLPLVGMNSIYSTIGNGIGYIIEKKKNKAKLRLPEFLKELYTGAIMGVVGTAIYTWIDKIPVEKIVAPLQNIVPRYYGIAKNMAKTLAFNPGLLMPYLGFYKGFTYLRDNFSKMREKKRTQGVGIFRQLYDDGIRKDYAKGVGKLFKLFPIHYVNVNYITHVPTRIMVGVMNDILFRLFQKKEVKALAQVRARPDSDYGHTRPYSSALNRNDFPAISQAYGAK